jgi:hypothetical protein
MNVFTTAFVQLDPALQVFVELAVTLVVSFLTLQVAAVFPALAEYLGQYKASIVLWGVGIAVQLIQAQLNKIPFEWDSVAFLAMKLLAEVLVVLFGFAAVRTRQLKGYRAL